MTSVLIDSNELLGKTLGSCTLERLVGRGGMGAVYLAQQSRPRRAVAIKVLMPGSVLLEGEQRADFLTRFRREADAIAALDHVNIMPLYEYGEEGQLAYLVMPYVTGGSLRDALEKQGKFSINEALPILEQAAAALNYAHERGIVHRDLKPGNILFHSDGRALLADFGLAKMIRGSNDLEAETLTALTTAGMVIGTPEYLSPEQANAMPIDQRADIYSLGIVLYQMLSGRLPFTGATPVAIAIKHMMEKPPSLSAINQAIPPRIEAVIMKAISKNPDDRYEHANDLVDAYREAMNTIYTASNNRTVLPTQPETPQPVPHVEPARQNMLPPPARADIGELATAYVEQPQNTQAASIDQNATQMSTPASPPTQLPVKPALVQVSLNNEATAEVSPDAKTIGTFPATPPPDVNHNPMPDSGGGKRPVFKILLALVVVFVLAGGLIAVLTNITRPQNTNNQSSNSGTVKKQTTPASTATTSPVQGQTSGTPTVTATPTPPPLNLPALKVGSGTLLYGTLQPGSCDIRGGTWSTVGNTQMSCDTDDTSVISNNDITRQMGGIFLDKLPNGRTISGNYTVQFQAKIKSGDGFAVFGNVNSQHNSGMSIRVQGSGSFDGYSYKSQGVVNQLFSPISSTGINGWTTYTVTVQGTQMTLYVNGNQVAYGDSSDLSKGTFGLGSSNGSNVLFKDVGVYSNP